MKYKKKAKSPILQKVASNIACTSLMFPRPICLENCTMNIQKGYEKYIFDTLKSFSNEGAYYRKYPHKLEGGETWSLDIKSRNDIYRMLFKVEHGICKIIDLCTDKTH